MQIDPSAALGPSLAWRYAGDNLQYLMAGALLTLQVGHPVVGAGVGEYSVYKSDPWGRLERTTKFVIRLLYGGPEEAAKASRELLALHAKIKGTDSKGRKYAALNREAYAWVHLTSYWSMLAAQEHFGTPLDEAEKIRLYREWLQQGRLLGLDEAEMPRNVEAFNEYFDTMIDDRLEENEVVRDLLGTGRAVPKPPRLARLPDAAWKRLYGYTEGWTRIATLGTLPPLLRKKLGIPFSTTDRFRFQVLKEAVRRTIPLVPNRFRYLPAGYRAMKEAGMFEREAILLQR
jgi:uncharacterized protein (DUF2236 family)